MDRLILLFIRFRNFFLYLFLLSLSLIYAFQSSNPLSDNLTRLSLVLIAPIHHSANSVYGYFGLKKNNDSLLTEIRELKEFKINHHASIKFLVDDSVRIDMNRYHLHNANIIYSTRNFDVNFFIIDKGKNDGIRSEMGVIHHDGVLGITKDISPNYSRVISILHKDIRINIRNQQTKDVGIMRWSMITPTKMEVSDFQKSKKISLNDTIITSGISSFFPASIPLGIISKIDSVSDPIYYRLEVELFENPFSQRWAYIVEDLKKIEIDSLLLPI